MNPWDKYEERLACNFYCVKEPYIQSEMKNYWRIEMLKILRNFLHAILNCPIHMLSQLYSKKADSFSKQ